MQWAGDLHPILKTELRPELDRQMDGRMDRWIDVDGWRTYGGPEGDKDTQTGLHGTAGCRETKSQYGQVHNKPH